MAGFQAPLTGRFWAPPVIMEHRVRGQPTVSFGWLLILYLEREFMKVQVVDFREFSEEAERLWQKMIHSIQRVPSVKDP